MTARRKNTPRDGAQLGFRGVEPRVRKRKEHPIMTSIADTLNATGRACLMRNNTGAHKGQSAKGKPWFVRYGLGKGSADLVGLVRSTGRFLALEVKKPGEKAEPHQDVWLEGVRTYGGFAAVVTSVEEAFAALARAEQGAFR